MVCLTVERAPAHVMDAGLHHHVQNNYQQMSTSRAEARRRHPLPALLAVRREVLFGPTNEDILTMSMFLGDHRRWKKTVAAAGLYDEQTTGGRHHTNPRRGDEIASRSGL
jgi:hypothetical protein